MSHEDDSVEISVGAGAVVACTLLGIVTIIGLFWRGGDIRDEHVALEQLRLERDKQTAELRGKRLEAEALSGKPCRGWCSKGRGAPARLEGKCECIEISDSYRGPE